MKQNIVEILEQCEKLIVQNNTTKALEILISLNRQYPDDGRILFNLGKCSTIMGQNIVASKCYLKAYQMGYQKTEINIIFANGADINGKSKKAEYYYNLAMKVASTDQEKISSNYAKGFYDIRNKKYLSAEKISRFLINNYNENYFGYRLHFMIQFHKENYLEAKLYLEHIGKLIIINEDYLKDYYMVCQKILSAKELFSVLDNDERFIKIAPSFTLKKKFEYYSAINDKYAMSEVFKTLIKEYMDYETMFNIVFICVSKKDYKNAYIILQFILDINKNKAGIEYYMALYFQMFILYDLLEENITTEQIRFIKDMYRLFLNYAVQVFPIEILREFKMNAEYLITKLNE